MSLTVFKAIEYIQDALHNTDNKLKQYFGLDENYLNLKDNGWSINEILEHISLTNHYLLILIRKAVGKAEKNIHNLDLEKEIQTYNFDIEKFKNIALPHSFYWHRPDHMVPQGDKKLNEIRETIKGQYEECHRYLRQLYNGEGLLYTTTMTVNDLGKLNVYEYIYFLSQHTLRHIHQMEEILNK